MSEPSQLQPINNNNNDNMSVTVSYIITPKGYMCVHSISNPRQTSLNLHLQLFEMLTHKATCAKIPHTLSADYRKKKPGQMFNLETTAKYRKIGSI